jgi:hypothetical protein
MFQILSAKFATIKRIGFNTHRKKQNIIQNRCWDTNIQQFTGTTWTTENGHGILDTECEEFLHGKLTENSIMNISPKYKLHLVGVQEIWWDKCGAEQLYFFISMEREILWRLLSSGL